MTEDYIKAVEKRFNDLKEQMELHYFWCKVKLNAFCIFLLILLWLK